MSSGPQASAVAPHHDTPAALSPPTTASVAHESSSERRKPGLSSVANTANQILFKNELYTSMKQKTMDHEFMARLNKERQEKEKRRFEQANISVKRLESKRKIIIGIGDMSGPPGSDPNLYSPASISVALSPHDTIRDAKKKLIIAAAWTDELPEDFGLFDDISEDPFKDAMTLEFALSHGRLTSMGKGGNSVGGAHGRHAGGGGGLGGTRTPASPMKLPWPYTGVLWAARLG
eukprot:jgi/Undpi1/2116/HiC_scaffold_12.g05502.m1